MMKKPYSKPICVSCVLQYSDPFCGSGGDDGSLCFADDDDYSGGGEPPFSTDASIFHKNIWDDDETY